MAWPTGKRTAAPAAMIAIAVALLLAASAPAPGAQPAVFEREPNDTPATANPVSGAVRIAGVQVSTDQDGFMWTVSDTQAGKRWTFELTGIVGGLTVVDVFRIEYADNGIDVVAKDKLFTLGARGARPRRAENLIFQPGDYLLGIAHAGGGSDSDMRLFQPDAVLDGDALKTTGSDNGNEAGNPQAQPGAYRLAVREGDKLNVARRTPENDVRESAYEIGTRGEHAAFYTAPETWYGLEVPEGAEAARWRINAQTAIGEDMELTLFDPDGAELTQAKTGDRAQLSIPGLGLEPGVYPVRLTSQTGSAIRTFSTLMTGVRVDGEEAEPNDDWRSANELALTRGATGAIGVKRDEDFYRFDWTEEQSRSTFSLALETNADERIRLCLLDRDGRDVQCRVGRDSTAMENLFLPPGEHGLRIAGSDPDVSYSLTFAAGAAYDPAREVEPNDDDEIAVAMPGNRRIRGRLDGDDTDWFRLTTAEPAQLWRIQTIGEGVRSLSLYDGAGKRVTERSFGRGSRRARLDNVFLVPGTHYFEVAGRDADYALLARPLGPPPVGMEREPNDDETRFERLGIGTERTGLLTDEADHDGYRFSLRHHDHIRLEAAPPVDGALAVRVTRENLGGQGTLKQSGDVGEPVVLEGLFPPADYTVKVSANTPSDAEYTLTLNRLARFACPGDCEPNDHRGLARPIPRDGVIAGRPWDWYKFDFFRLPVFERDTELVIDASGNVLEVVTQTDDSDLAEYDREAGRYTATLPADTPTFLWISGRDDYRLELAFPNRPDWLASGASPLTAELVVEHDEVAAYHRFGQRVAGTLMLENPSTTPREAIIETATSDERWALTAERDSVTVPAGAGISVPLTVKVPPDAWADAPVRVSAAARDAAGGMAGAGADIRPDPEARAVSLIHGWPLPEPMVGGPNVAWAALGGGWAPPDASDKEIERDEIFGAGSGYAQLFDGLSVENNGLTLGARNERRFVVAGLAGDAPVDVVGITLNPHGSRKMRHAPRDFALDLSLDGSNWTTVLEATGEPVRAEQPFLLEAPTPARFARLRFITDYSDEKTPGVGLGEWKVVAEPGTDLTGGAGYNLADIELGGHVVWSRPKIENVWDNTILRVDDKDPYAVRVDPGRPMRWVVAFHHQRAARIRALEWLVETGADPARAIDEVSVAVATDSPFGPWTGVGTWPIETSDAVQRLEFDEPVWARYVRFSVAADESDARRAPPERIGIIEAPSGPDYRSVLTEWGFASTRSYFESLRQPSIRAEATASGNNTRETAFALAPGETVNGEVEVGVESDWYRFTIPDGHNVAAFELAGEPTVRTVLATEDAAGDAVRARRGASRTALHRYDSLVEGGREYWVRVEEPPRNVVFAWDTSASVGAYLPVIYNALAAYAEDVVPGRDAVNFIPFGGSMMAADWYSQPYRIRTLLNELPRDTSSSAAEKTLARATRALGKRPGTKAIVLITDAATTRHAPVWDAFAEIRPRIFGLGLSSAGAFSRNPPREQDLMQGWADVNGGHYDHVLSPSEMEVAFDRAATLLRAPAPYTLTVSTRFDENAGKPGTLAVTTSGGGDDGSGPIAAGAVELILDASGSMLQRMQGRRRIAIARELLIQAVDESLPAGAPLALRVFGHREPNACRTDLEQPLAPLDKTAMKATLGAVEAMNLARTPIADSLAKVPDDLEDARGRATVVLVTDGEETCDGEPAAVIEDLAAEGVSVTLNIVGFAIDDPALAETFEQWAAAGGGRYLPADDPDELASALRAALRARFEVRNTDGDLVAAGEVGGAPVELDAGVYDVAVLTDPARRFQNVEIPAGGAITLEADSPSR